MERQNVMRAVRYHEYGGVETLTVEQAPDPHPGPDEIRVRVAAPSVNSVDWKVRSGAVRDLLPVDLPAIPGRDAVGVVDKIGATVRGVSVGDRVFGLGGVTGATAELAILSAWAPAPATWSDEQAAAPAWPPSPRWAACGPSASSADAPSSSRAPPAA